MSRETREVPLLSKIGCYIFAFAITVGIFFVFFIPMIVWVLTGTFTYSDNYALNIIPLSFILARLTIVGFGLILIGFVFDF